MTGKGVDMKLQNAWFRSLLTVASSAFRIAFSALRSVGQKLLRGGSEALPEFVLSFGMLPSPTRDPAIDAWNELKKRRGHRRDSKKPPSTPAKVLPIRGSVDDPVIRITM